MSQTQLTSNTRRRLVDTGVHSPADPRGTSMSLKRFAAIVGAVLAVAGIVLLSTSTSAASPLTGWQLNCGSVFSSNVDQVRHDANVDDLANGLAGLPGEDQPMSGVQACEDALGTRGLIGWLIGGLGVLVLAGALLIRTGGQGVSAETSGWYSRYLTWLNTPRSS